MSRIRSESRTGLPATSLLVALDGSGFAERAVVPAGRLAVELGVPLHLWSAAPTLADAEDRQARMRCMADAGGASWEVVVTDRPVEAMTAKEDAAGRPLVCLATHGRDRTAALAHSVSAAVVAAADGPVLLVGPEVPAKGPAGRHVAACVDGSPDSKLIVAAAAAWAAALGLDVTVVTVAEPVPESVRRPGHYPRLHGPDGDADAYIEELAAAWRGDVAVTGRAVYDPVDVDGALLDAFAADPPYLVVMGTRAPHGLRRLILGSIAAAVAHAAPAPVLVVPFEVPAVPGDRGLWR
ncbi:MAG: universal stress protein [Actinomycetota bacterium]|jgi:nucleotide-binding universal stress UspA family protein